jgi:FkbM family methyltransferase
MNSTTPGGDGAGKSADTEMNIERSRAKGALYRRIVRTSGAMRRRQPWRLLRSLLHPLRRIVRRHLNPLGVVALEVQDFVMFVDTRDIHVAPSLAADGIWEPHITSLLKAVLRPGMTFVDAGANIGYYTVLASRLIGPTGRVLAFEPDPANFRLLRQNVEVNECSNVTLVQKALGEDDKGARLYLSPDDLGDHSTIDSSRYARALAVDTLRMDEVFSDPASRIDWVKLDTQGSELSILGGMQGIFESGRFPSLICEYCPMRLRRCGTDPNATPTLLKSIGYDIEVIGVGNERSRSMDVRDLMEFADRVIEVDLLCTRHRPIPSK